MHLDDDLSKDAYKLAQSHLPPSVLNHSVCRFLAGWLAQRERSEWLVLTGKVCSVLPAFCMTLDAQGSLIAHSVSRSKAPILLRIIFVNINTHCRA